MKASVYFNIKNEELAKSKEVNHLDEILNNYESLVSTNKTAPVITIPALIAAGKAVADVYNFLFGGKDLENLKNLVKYLQTEIQDVFDILTEVVDILKQLAVLYRDELRQLALYKLKASIYIIIDNYDSWTKDLAVSKSEIIDTLNSLKSDTTVAIEYGYTHYDSIALAISQEYQLSVLIQKDKASINSSLSRYIQYFERAVNYSITGSLADRKVQIAKAMYDLNSRFGAKDINCGVTEEKHYRCRVYYDIHLLVSGDIMNGFSYRVENRKNGRSECEEHPGPHFQSISYLIPDADVTSDTINSYEQARKSYLAMIEQAKILQEAMENCNTYVDFLKKLIASEL